MTLSPSDFFRTTIARRNPAAERWFDDAVAAAASGDLSRIPFAYTAAPRQTGRGALADENGGLTEFLRGAPGLSVPTWTVFDTARALLLTSISAVVAPDAFERIAIDCYEQGDAREQQSWLKGLALLPSPERFLTQAVDACRTNIVPVFESIACENPYPARHFPERNFNQLVLKALFVGVAIERIVDLRPRLNGELQRMALDFAAERKAAGRAVPPDLALAVMDETTLP